MMNESQRISMVDAESPNVDVGARLLFLDFSKITISELTMSIVITKMATQNSKLMDLVGFEYLTYLVN